jgi:hypothetical protein
MKNFLVIVSLLAAVASSTAAAEDKLHVGVLGGLNFASAALSPEQSYDLAAMNRGNVGGFAEYDMTPNLSLEARGAYVQKGVQTDRSNRGFRGTATIDFVSFPVLLKVKANRAAWKPFLAIGTELALKTSAKAVLQANGREEEDEDFDSGVRSTDFALNLGGGIEIPRGRVSFRIEGLYSLGLVNLVKIPDDQVASAKTRTFLINVGVGF